MKSGFSLVIVKGNDQARNFSQQLAIDADKGPPMAPVMRKLAELDPSDRGRDLCGPVVQPKRSYIVTVSSTANSIERRRANRMGSHGSDAIEELRFASNHHSALARRHILRCVEAETAD